MAKELPFFRFTASEWLNGDISLETSYLKGVFIDVCAYYWFKDCSITLAMLKKKDDKNIDAFSNLIDLKIIKHDKKSDFIKIDFLDEQYDLLSGKRLKRQIAGALGGKQKASNATSLLKQNPSYKDKYKDNNNEKENKSESVVKESKFIFKSSLISLGIEPSILDDWLIVRKQKKCANTQTSFNKIKKEIEQSDLTANECIKIAVEKSWGGFESKWIKNTENGTHQQINFGSSKRVDQNDTSIFRTRLPKLQEKDI